jgi:hypothetical protein
MNYLDLGFEIFFYGLIRFNLYILIFSWSMVYVGIPHKVEDS